MMDVGSTAVVDLGYSGTADTIAVLKTDGVTKASGVWGSGDSVVANTNELFIGLGQLNVGGTPLVNTPTVISSTTVSGGNIIIISKTGAKNVALPLSNWTSLATNQIDGAGNFSFTNAIESGVPRQFYQSLVP